MLFCVNYEEYRRNKQYFFMIKNLKYANLTVRLVSLKKINVHGSIRLSFYSVYNNVSVLGKSFYFFHFQVESFFNIIVQSF